MAKCRVVQENLTAWIDGELSPRWDDRVRRHLTGCPGCAAAADGLRKSIEMQRQTLARVTAVADFDSATAWVHLQRALRAPIAGAEWIRNGTAAASPPPVWLAVLRAWLTGRLAVAGAAMAVAAALLVLLVAGGPKAVLIPLGVTPPPVAVTRQPDLFKDYALIEELDALENFDTVESVPLDDDQASFSG